MFTVRTFDGNICATVKAGEGGSACKWLLMAMKSCAVLL